MAAIEEVSYVPKGRFLLEICFDGSGYSGWQIQPHCLSVQEVVQKTLTRLYGGQPIHLIGASRTDAGVHALDQQVSFDVDLPADMPPDEVAPRLQRWLPDDIVIKSWRICEQPFHARYDNCGKAYTYCIAPGFKPNPLFQRFFWRTPHPLDLDAMRRAAAILQGEHDFASFAVNPGKEVESTIRNLRRLEVLDSTDGLVYINAVGDSFLYKMVRSLTGFLVHVGYGYAAPEDAARVLEGRNRSLAADSAPACGLFLTKVFFQPDAWQNYIPLLPPFQWIARLV